MESSELIPGILAIGKAAFFKKTYILAISDLQLGYETTLREKGIFVPEKNLESIKKELEKTLEHLKDKGYDTKKIKILINGDFKHEFSKVSKQEFKEGFQLLEFLLEEKKVGKVIVVKGNHDTGLEAIVRWHNVLLVKEYFEEEEKILFLHGDYFPDEKSEAFREAKTIVIGHEHPAFTLRKAAKAETYKCFLLGNFKGKKLLVLPSFSNLTFGNDLSRNDAISPFLKNVNIEEMDIWLIEDKAYYFGKVRNLL